MPYKMTVEEALEQIEQMKNHLHIRTESVLFADFCIDKECIEIIPDKDFSQCNGCNECNH